MRSLWAVGPQAFMDMFCVTSATVYRYISMVDTNKPHIFYLYMRNVVKLSTRRSEPDGHACICKLERAEIDWDKFRRRATG